MWAALFGREESIADFSNLPSAYSEGLFRTLRQEHRRRVSLATFLRFPTTWGRPRLGVAWARGPLLRKSCVVFGSSDVSVGDLQQAQITYGLGEHDHADVWGAGAAA